MDIPVDIDYAMRHTKVLYAPARCIDTFGDTRFNFSMVSELQDVVGECRIRSGWVEASRPRILRPADMVGVEMDGFSPGIARIFEWMKEKGIVAPSMFKYGFRFSRSDVREELVHDVFPVVSERVVQDALDSGNPLRAVISGVDDAWEASLLRFMVEMIQQSHEINIFDFKRRGML